MFSITVKKHDRRYCVDGEDFERERKTTYAQQVK